MSNHEKRLADLLDRTDEEWEAIQDATMTVYSLRAGHTLTQADVDAISLYDKDTRHNEEGAIEAYHRGVADGRQEAAGTDMAAVLAKLDKTRSELFAQRGLTKFYSALLRKPETPANASQTDKQDLG